MYLNDLPTQIFPSGDLNITTTTNNIITYFLEYECGITSGIQEEIPDSPNPDPKPEPKPKTWQEKADKKRDDNLRGLFGYD